MRSEDRSDEIRDYLARYAFCIDEIKIACQMEILFSGFDPVRLYQLGLAKFSRIEAELMFTYSAKIWGAFSLQNWESLIQGVERQDASYLVDHGGYSDIWFLVDSLRINAFRLARKTLADARNLQKIIEYGMNHSELILREKPSNEEDEVDDCNDLYGPVFKTCLSCVRAKVLTQDSTLDMNAWSVDDLDRDLQVIAHSIH